MFLYRYCLLLSYALLSLGFNSCNPFHEERTTYSADSLLFSSVDTLKSADSSKILAIHLSDTLVPSPAIKIQLDESVLTPIPSVKAHTVNTGKVKPTELVEFAKTLIGVKYKYASIDPKTGFDCSGFITYVFNHFKIAVPRASIDFTHVGKAVPMEMAKVGDIILFTGTNKAERFVGHMGIIVSNTNNELEFIHSTSGKAFGVTISPLSDYYKGRYLKTIRVFPQNDL